MAGTVKMGKEGHDREPEELVMEEEDEEEVGLLRGSKSNVEREISKEVRNCHVEKNSYADSLSVSENGAQASIFDSDPEGVKEHVHPTPAERAQERAQVKDSQPRLEICEKEEDVKPTRASSVKDNGTNPRDVSILGSAVTDPHYLETLPQEPRKVHKSPTIEEIERDGVDLITDSETEAKDYDVENVLQKQNTHDLYCPNCHSCITRRVVIRKRKRKTRISSEDIKRSKLEAASGSKDDVCPTQLTSVHCHDDPPISPEDTPISDPCNNEPRIFRCLSCFSFFIPTESGFKLFRIFGEKEDTRDEQGVKMKKNWFSSFFSSDKGKVFADEGGKDHLSNVVKNNNEEATTRVHVGSISIDPQGTSGSNSLISLNNELERAGENTVDTVEKSDGAVIGKQDFGSGDPNSNFKVYSNHQMNLSNENIAIGAIDDSLTPADKTQVSGERLVDGTLSANQTGLNILVTSNSQPLTLLKKKQADKICHTEMHMRSSVSSEDPRVPSNGACTDDESDMTVISPVSVLKGSETGLEFEDRGKDTIITVEEGPTATAELISLPNVTSQLHVVNQEGTNERKGIKIEIIKSIVYGGLAESITSLSVVSSAAGGGTATLYILALGVANLIGGFLTILNNLWELKKDRGVEEASGQNLDDQYRETLGNRQNFTIHATAVLLSYTLFGIVPPTVYGFSFRKSDGREFKLATAAAASLLCIAVLAFGKVYAQRPPKSYLKTIVFYLVSGFLVSGVAFVAGEGINRVLQKLGLFQEPSSEIRLYVLGQGEYSS